MTEQEKMGSKDVNIRISKFGEGCGCALMILALGVVINVPAILETISKFAK